MALVALISAFVALVSVAFVVLVRKDAHDHAIWTVVVVSHLVVADHQEDEEEHQEHQRREILVVLESWSRHLLRFRV